MIRTTCEHCGSDLPRAGRGRPPRHCSGRCRVAAHRAKRAVPAELRERDRWVRAAADKRPLRADDGCPASVTEPGDWATHQQAGRSLHGTGPGYVLAAGDGIVCIDLDHCIDDGQLAAWAQAILDRCPRTFMELSASGKGLHVWGRGEVQHGRRIRRADGACIEVYGTGRYIALGTRYGAAPLTLADLAEVVDTLI